MRVRVVVVSSAIVAIAVVPWVAWWSTLPEEVASHWGLSGDPNGHMARGLALFVLPGIAIALAVALVVTDRLHATLHTTPVLAFVGGTIASASLGTVVANSDKSSWRDAGSPLGFVVLGLVVSVGAAILVRREEPPVPVDPSPPRLRLRPGERVAWTGSVHSPAVVRIAIGVGVLGGALLTVHLEAGIITLAGALVCAMFASTTIYVGERGVRIHGAFSWPRMTIALDRIERAEAIDVNPLQWGGWGYRGSLRVFNRAAWILKRGPGLKLDLTGGQVFVVTVDHAEEAAAVLNGLRVTSTPQ